jgi:hypothetical protein
MDIRQFEKYWTNLSRNKKIQRKSLICIQWIHVAAFMTSAPLPRNYYLISKTP